jgi:hypothetical protein
MASLRNKAPSLFWFWIVRRTDANKIPAKFALPSSVWCTDHISWRDGPEKQTVWLEKNSSATHYKMEEAKAVSESLANWLRVELGAPSIEIMYCHVSTFFHKAYFPLELVHMLPLRTKASPRKTIYISLYALLTKHTIYIFREIDYSATGYWLSPIWSVVDGVISGRESSWQRPKPASWITTNSDLVDVGPISSILPHTESFPDCNIVIIISTIAIANITRAGQEVLVILRNAFVFYVPHCIVHANIFIFG